MNSPETSIAFQDITVRFPDQHTIKRYHMKTHLNQYILKENDKSCSQTPFKTVLVTLSDEHLISPYNIHTLSGHQGMRTG